LITFMVAVGHEDIGGVLTYPDSSQIPCDIVTLDPTTSPTVSPTAYPTLYPTRIPTSAPTFALPQAGFVDTDFITHQTLYNIQEGGDGIKIQVFLSPASLYPLTLRWQIVNSSGYPLTEGFNETSGMVTFGQYQVNYKTENPACSVDGGSCILGYDCVSHEGSDYCVKHSEKVYAKVYLSAYDDGIQREEPQSLSLVFLPADHYVNDEFYSNASHYTVDIDADNATIMLYDAHSEAFCEASPTSPSCIVNEGFVVKAWMIFILILLILLLIFAIYYARYKYVKWQQAKRGQLLAEEAYRDEILIGEEGFGTGMTSAINPFALKTTNYDDGNYVPPVIPSDDENDVIGRKSEFSLQKQQFRPAAG